ncbi:hypothetical protein [Pelagerythrobacter rhizovicinus]|uniref:hypothetical protein n=1 Tax=Pelagerythrobacter rhizovicinus TaxID=2268576 RepID=UPI001787469C|nr:hypothetical protein [Pelagerythrobacter rhizovicinus]
MTRRTDNREARLPAPAGELPAFTPVPRQCQRHDGWTDERQRAFIEALADTGSVEAACRAVNMSQPGAYELRRQPGAESFRQAWEAALQLGVQRIEDVAMERALNGVEVPVYSYGKLVGTRRTYNDRLLMFMLRNRAPERFTEGKAKGLNAIGKMELERLKKQWRQEWEEEKKREASYEHEDEVLASIDRKLGKMRERFLFAMSPRTRALHDAYEAARQEDEANGYNPYEDPEHPASLAYKNREREKAGLPELPRPQGEYPTVVNYREELEKELEGEDDAAGDETPEPPPTEPHGPRIRTLKDDGW